MIKITVFLTTAFLLQAVAETKAQKITLSARNATLQEVMYNVQRQQGYSFFFLGNEIAKTRVSVKVRQAELADAMAAILAEKGLDWSIEDQTIIIKRSNHRPTVERLLTNPVPEEIQQRMVAGQVTDDGGNPLEGATVRVSGTNTATTTNASGQYEIPIPEGGTALTYTLVGFEAMESTIGDQSVINISLRAVVSDLEEVVVVGYGTQKKANLTGSISVVNMEDVLGSRPVSNAAQALQGAVPGLEVTQFAGRPGTPTSLNIRGINSINGGSPLVLVDNVPMNIDLINPQDIETVTVLKDASASSIYGARAAFGVILITTKKGRKNQPLSVSYAGNLVSTYPTDFPQKASPFEMAKALKDWGTNVYYTGQHIDTWIDFLNDYEANPASYPEGLAYDENGQRYPLKRTDVMSDYMGTGFEHMHNLSLNGGSEKVVYRMGLGHTNEDGILQTDRDSYRRYNLNLFLQTDITQKLTASLNVLYNNNFRVNPPNSSTMFAQSIALPPYAPTGYATLEDGSSLPYYTPGNIIRTEAPRTNFGDDTRIFGKLQYDVLSGLSVTAEYTFNKTNANERNPISRNQYMNAELFNTQYINNISRYSRLNAQTDYHALNVYASYERKWADAHKFNFLLGTNQEVSSFETFSAQRDDLISAQTPSFSTSTGVTAAGDGFYDFAISGYFGRLNYDYKNRYLLELNGRFDGSSRFADDHRFGFFPSMSVGWVITEEPFMEGIRGVVDQLKIRASYGEIGNQEIQYRNVDGNLVQDYYPYIPGMEPFNSSWLNPATNLLLTSLAAPKLVSAGLTWETVRSQNIGIDISLLDGRLNTTFDLFTRKTLNMLTKGAELPASLGAEAPLQNVADLKSEGWDWEIAWKDRRDKFSYSVGFNLSDNRGFITRFNNSSGLLSEYYVGQEIGEIWGYTTNGFFSVDDFVPGTLNENLMGGTLKEGIPAFRGVAQNPGDVKYKDVDGDGEIFSGNSTLTDPGDRSVIGNSNRRYQYGVFGSLSYANFDFSFLLQGVGKRNLWVSNVFFWPNFSEFAVVHKNQLDYWTPAREDAFFPRGYEAGAGNGGTNRMTQTKYLSNGAYMRVKNLSLGYTFSGNWLNVISLKNARLFVTAENLFTFKHLPAGMDPEVSTVGGGTGYPFAKKVNFGVNLNF